MKYSELIQFEPIETVVQLREADTAAIGMQARTPTLLSSFVPNKD